MGARDLLYFNPDPEIPDADLLGIGDLIYSDGSTQYVNDPELVAGLPGLPPGMNPQGSVGMGPPAPDAMSAQPMGPPAMPEPILIDSPQGPVQMDMAGNLRPMEGVQDPQTGELLDPGQTSNFLPALGGEIANAAKGYPQPIGQAWGQQMGGSPSPTQGPPPVTIQSERGPVTIDPTGNIQQGAGGVPLEQLQQQMQSGGMGAAGGMVPVQREGALPTDVYQRQAGELGAMNAQTLAATEQARRDEARLYNELALQQMAANEAERVKREQELADNQARSERLRAEMQAINDVQIEQDIISARGPVGGFLGVIGAVLMGAAGNDAGFRMLDRQVDRYTQDQVRIKGTKLNMLAEQLGSTNQAIAAGKAALYKVGADRLELLAQKVKGDVYEAQSPAIIQSLRQKQLEQMQAFERDSLGKTLEKTPLPPKPPSPEMLQKYGELRRERAGNESITQRMDQTLGLIWEPGRDGQPGRYRNREEVLAKGIQGTGNLEQLIPDIVYATGGGVTAEGRQVRGAAEAMAFAQLRAVQPTGPISNSDIERAVKMGALDTEEGLLLGLERMHQAAEQQLTHDAAQFGPDVVGEYERRRRASGGQPLGQMPAASRPATLEEKRQGAAAARGGGQPQASAPPGAGGDAMAVEPAERMAMIQGDLQTLAGDQLPPEGIAILVAQAAHETADGARLPRNNFFGHKASARAAAAGRGSANLETTEGEGAAAQRVRQNFATFNSSTESAADHLSLLQRNYPRAWEALLRGDADGYVAALKDGGYFTGNEDAYRSALLRRL